MEYVNITRMMITPSYDVKVQLVYKTPWTFRLSIYKLPIQAYYQTINVRNMNKSI